MKIKPLPPEVISKLRSGVAITCVAQCVEELVLNSLDAGATCIAVRLNLPFYKVQVVDNGKGISPDQLQLVGERYATSKCHSLEDLSHFQSSYGYRGEALASLRDMSTIVEIESRTRNSSHTYCKIFTRGKSGNVSKTLCHRPSVGTTVTVLDFMYNMPVRRKGISEVLDLEFCRQRLECIALINPAISISLRNDVTGEQIFQSRKTSSTYLTFINLFGHDKAANLKELEFLQGKYKLHGYISTIGHMSKQLQFLYVNNRLVLKTKLHKLINSVLNKHLFTRQRTSLTLPNLTSSSPSKSQDRYSIFVLKISCPLDIYDITLEPQKSLIEFQDWNEVTKIVEDALLYFLEQNNLLQSPVNNNDLSQKRTLSNSPDAKCCNAKHGRQISTENTKNALFSLAVKRIHSEEKDDLIFLEDAKAKEREERSLPSVENSQVFTKLKSSHSVQNEMTSDNELVSNEKDISVNDSVCKGFTKLQHYCKQNSLGTVTGTLMNSNRKDEKSNHSEIILPRSISLRNVEVNDDFSGRSSLQLLRHKHNAKPVIKKLRYLDSEGINLEEMREESPTKKSSDSDSEETGLQEIKKKQPTQFIRNGLGNCISDKPFMMQAPVVSSLSVLANRNRKKIKLSELQTNFKYQHHKNRATRLRCISSTKHVSIQEYQHTIKDLLTSDKLTKIPHVDNSECENEKLLPKNVKEVHKQSIDEIKLCQNAGAASCSSTSKNYVSIGRILHTQENDVHEASLDVSNTSDSQPAAKLISDNMQCVQPPHQSQKSSDFEQENSLYNTKLGPKPLHPPLVSDSELNISCMNNNISSMEDNHNGKKYISNSLNDSSEMIQHCEVLLPVSEPISVPRHKPCQSVFEPSTLLGHKGENNLSEKHFDFGTSFSHNLDILSANSTAILSRENNTVENADSPVKNFQVGQMNIVPDLSGNTEEYCQDVKFPSVELQSGTKLEDATKEFNFNPPLLRPLIFNSYPSTQGFIVTQSFDITDDFQKPYSVSNDNHNRASPLLNNSSCKDNFSKTSESSNVASDKLSPSCFLPKKSRKSISPDMLCSNMEKQDTLQKNLPSSQIVSKPEGFLYTTKLTEILQRDQVVASEIAFNTEHGEHIKKVACIDKIKESSDNLKQTEFKANCESSGNYSSDKMDSNILTDVIPCNMPCSPLSVQMQPTTTLRLSDNNSAPCKVQNLSGDSLSVEKDFVQIEANKILNNTLFVQTTKDSFEVPAENKLSTSNTSPSLLKDYSLECSGAPVKSDYLKSLHCDSTKKQVTSETNLDERNEPALLPKLLSFSSSKVDSEQIRDVPNGNVSVTSDSSTVFSLSTLFSEGDSLASDGNKQSKSPQAVQVIYAESSNELCASVNSSSLLKDSSSNRLKKPGNTCIKSLNSDDSTQGTAIYNLSLNENNLGEKDFAPPCIVDKFTEAECSYSSTKTPEQSFNSSKKNCDQIKHLSNENTSVFENSSFPSLNTLDFETKFLTPYCHDQGQTNKNSESKNETNNVVSTDSLISSEQNSLVVTENSTLSLDILFSHTSENSKETYQNGCSLTDDRQTKCDYHENTDNKSKTNSIVSSESFINIQQELGHQYINKIVPNISNSALQQNKFVPLNSQPTNSSVQKAVHSVQDGKENSKFTMMKQSEVHLCPRSVTQSSTDNSMLQQNFLNESSLLNSHLSQDTTSHTVESTSIDKEQNVVKSIPSKMWLLKKDPLSGKRIFINAYNGNSSYICPEDMLQGENNDKDVLQPNNSKETESAVKSHFFLSHNASPFMPRPRSLRGNKCYRTIDKSSNGVNSKSTFAEHFNNHVEDQEAADIAKKWKGDLPEHAVTDKVRHMFKEWKNPVFQKDSSEEVASICLSQNFKSTLQARNFMEPCCFSKSIFGALEVIGQVDCKFLACLIRSEDKGNKAHKMILLFDQHAVHERIRLEQLMENLYEEKTKEQCIKTSVISPPLILSLQPEEMSLLKAYHKRLSKLGLVLATDPLHPEKMAVSSVPVCLLEREANELKRHRPPTTEVVVQNLVREWLLLIQQTGGANITIPKTLLSILNSQACHGAVKFGDELSYQECCQLLKLLSTCKLPFQCAHGRPSVVSLVNLDHLHSIEEKRQTRPQLWKLSEAVAATKLSCNPT